MSLPATVRMSTRQQGIVPTATPAACCPLDAGRRDIAGGWGSRRQDRLKLSGLRRGLARCDFNAATAQYSVPESLASECSLAIALTAIRPCFITHDKMHVGTIVQNIVFHFVYAGIRVRGLELIGSASHGHGLLRLCGGVKHNGTGGQNCC